MTTPPIPDFAAFLESDPRDLPEPDNLASIPCVLCEISRNEHCDLCGGSGEITELSMTQAGLI